MEIGDRIKTRREEIRMSQEELAKRAGYKSRSSINKIEVDGRGLPQSKIVAISKALQTTPAYLMGWDDNQEHVIHKNLAYLIRRDNVTLDKLSKETDIDIDRLQAIYNDEENLIVSETKALANFFGVTNTQLMKEKLYENIIETQEHYMSKEENEILCMVRELNNEGQNKVFEYIKDLSDKYRKKKD